MNRRLFFSVIVIAILAIVAFIGAGWMGFSRVSPAKEETIKIGAILPLTGTNARYGILEKTGLEMALKEINDAGGINAKKLEISYEDSKADPKQALDSWKKILLDKDVPLVVSGLSGVCMALGPVANSDQTVLFATDCSVAQFSSPNDFTFRITNSNAGEGEQMAEFLLSKGITSIAVLKINNDYGTGFFPAFEKEFTSRGQIKILQAYDPAQKDFKTEISRIRGTNIQGILLISYAPDAEIIIKQLKEFGISLPLFAAEPIENNDFLKNAGKNAEGIIYLKAALNGPEGEAFARKAEATLGRYPEINIARTYDLLHIATDALKACNSAKTLNPNCIQIQLYQTKQFEGVLGTIGFDYNGDVHIPYAVKTIRNGKFELYTEN